MSLNMNSIMEHHNAVPRAYVLEYVNTTPHPLFFNGKQVTIEDRTTNRLQQISIICIAVLGSLIVAGIIFGIVAGVHSFNAETTLIGLSGIKIGVVIFLFTGLITNILWGIRREKELDRTGVEEYIEELKRPYQQIQIQQGEEHQRAVMILQRLSLAPTN